MNSSVVVYQIHNHKRSAVLCRQAKIGLEKAGFKVELKWENEYSYPEGDIAVFYGYCNNLPKIMEEYSTSIYIDLGYWERVSEHRYQGSHKLSVNGRHPTAYFQKFKHDSNRLNVTLKPWKLGNHILVTGMSGKGAVAEGYKPQEWENNAISILREHTNRPIWYRPKPSWPMAFPIEGSIYSDKTFPLTEVLKNCHAVVTHHSNCAVDALMLGIPVFVVGGVARPMGLQDITKIETPYYPDDRQQWAQDVSYCQWTTSELSTDIPWRHLRSEGLI